MEPSILGVMFFWGLFLVFGFKNPGEFHREYYRGPANRAIVAIVHKNSSYRTTKCYGTLVNWRVALVPCSCVIKRLNQNQEGVWYDNFRNFKVAPDNPSFFKALLMPFEHHEPRIIGNVITSVTKITLDPKCNSGFQYNMAKIELSKPLYKSKMAWVANPYQDRMKKIIRNFGIGVPVMGSCIINLWVVPNNSTASEKFLPRLDEVPVTLVPWDSCANVVCPKNVDPPKGKKINRNMNVCNNQISKSRQCVEWEEYGSLCDITPGTPVFCNAGRLMGLTGFIHNSSMWCNEFVTTKQAVMEGIDLALPLIKYDLRVINILKNKTGL